MVRSMGRYTFKWNAEQLGEQIGRFAGSLAIDELMAVNSDDMINQDLIKVWTELMRNIYGEALQMIPHQKKM